MPAPAEMPNHSYEEVRGESSPPPPEQLALEDITVPEISSEAKIRNLHDRLQADVNDEHALAELSKLPDDQWGEYNRYASRRALLESGVSTESADEVIGHPVTDEEILAKWHEAGVDEHEELKATPILEEMYYNPDSPKVRARLESMTLSPEEAAAVGPEKAAQLAAQKAKLEDDFETYRAQRQARVHLGDVRDAGEAQEHLVRIMDEHKAEGGIAAPETFEALKSVKAKLPAEAYKQLEEAYLGDLVASKGSTSFEVTRAMHELDLPQAQYTKIMEARSLIDTATPEELQSLTPEEIKELTKDDPDALKLLETRKTELAEVEAKAKAELEVKAEAEAPPKDDASKEGPVPPGPPPAPPLIIPPASSRSSSSRDPAEAPPLPFWLDDDALRPAAREHFERRGYRRALLKLGAAAVFAMGLVAGGTAVSSLQSSNSTLTVEPTASSNEASKAEMGGGGTADEIPNEEGHPKGELLHPVEQTVRLGTWNPDRSQGAIWYIAKNNLREHGMLRPTDQQVHDRTQRILDHNKLTWDQAKDLGSKYRVKIPPLA